MDCCTTQHHHQHRAEEQAMPVDDTVDSCCGVGSQNKTKQGTAEDTVSFVRSASGFEVKCVMRRQATCQLNCLSLTLQTMI